MKFIGAAFFLFFNVMMSGTSFAYGDCGYSDRTRCGYTEAPVRETPREYEDRMERERHQRRQYEQSREAQDRYDEYTNPRK